MESNTKRLNKFIIFSHGFGVHKDSRGMFTEIAGWFPEYNCILFDYNTLPDNNTIVASLLSDQAKKFAEVLTDLIKQKPEAQLSIIAHSQGAVPVALAVEGKIDHIVLLAPSMSKDINKSVKYFLQYPGTRINLEGESVLERKDGSKTLVPKEFWQDRQKYEPITLYNKLAERYDTTVVLADSDEVVANQLEDLSQRIKKIHINADHNFTGEARNELKRVLLEIFEK